MDFCWSSLLEFLLTLSLHLLVNVFQHALDA